MSRRPIDQYEEPTKWSPRFRKVFDQGGSQVVALETRYSYAWGLRPTTGPRGGRRYQRFPRMTYYMGGRFFRLVNTHVSARAWQWRIVPVRGTLFDAHPVHTSATGDAPAALVRLDQDGRPLQVVDVNTQMALWTPDMGLDYFEMLLGLDREYHPRSKKSTTRKSA